MGAGNGQAKSRSRSRSFRTKYELRNKPTRKKRKDPWGGEGPKEKVDSFTTSFCAGTDRLQSDDHFGERGKGGGGKAHRG